MLAITCSHLTHFCCDVGTTFSFYLHITFYIRGFVHQLDGVLNRILAFPNA